MRLHQRQHDAIISIHALRKESDNDGIGGAFASPISIHALRKESDWCDMLSKTFYQISIHALRKESDSNGWCDCSTCRNFNPRSP